MRGMAVFVLICAASARGQTPDERTLARHGLEPTQASLGRYLRSLRPEAATRERIDRLVAQLGARDAGERDHAARELVRLGTSAIAALERATDHDEPEVRLQARRLLNAAEGRQTEELLYSVFRVIRTREIMGLAPEVLHVLPLATDAYLRDEAGAALVATAREEDLNAMLKAAAQGDPNARMACFGALRKLSGEKARPVLRAALRDPSGRVRLAAAVELANLGERESLAVLVDLLDEPDDWIRYRAVAALRSIAGGSHGFEPGMDAEQRAPAARRWREWVAGEGDKIVWQTPLRWHTTHRGRTLVALYGGEQVVELDDNGKIVWSVAGLSNPWAVRGLPDGHRLIAQYRPNIVFEYDSAGRRIWESEQLPGNISSVDRLANGNILVAVGTASDQILEIGRDKRIVWKLNMTGLPTSARVLPSGSLLVTLHDAGALVEIDREGREQWRVNGLNKPYSAERLANGNVLVACFGGQRIAEFDRDGALVWERRSIPGIYSATRLEDGSLVYADQGAVVRYSPTGTLAWRQPFPGGYLFLDRY